MPAWSERRQYAELAAEYGGYHLPTKGDEGKSGSGVILILPVAPAQSKECPIVIEARNAVEGEEENG